MIFSWIKRVFGRRKIDVQSGYRCIGCEQAQSMIINGADAVCCPECGVMWLSRKCASHYKSITTILRRIEDDA